MEGMELEVGGGPAGERGVLRHLGRRNQPPVRWGDEYGALRSQCHRAAHNARRRHGSPQVPTRSTLSTSHSLMLISPEKVLTGRITQSIKFLLSNCSRAANSGSGAPSNPLGGTPLSPGSVAGETPPIPGYSGGGTGGYYPNPGGTPLNGAGTYGYYNPWINAPEKAVAFSIWMVLFILLALSNF